MILIDKKEEEMEQAQEEDEQAPPPQEVAQEEPKPPKPGDGLEEDEARFAELQREFKESALSIDKEFINGFLGALSEEEADLQYSDLPSFLQMYEDRKMEFLKSEIGKRKQAIEELGGNIKKKKGMRVVGEGRSKFLEEFPDADLKAMAEFYKEEISPREQKAMKEASSTPYDLYVAIYKRMGGGESSEESIEEEEELPMSVEGSSATSSGDLDVDSEYLKKIGMK